LVNVFEKKKYIYSTIIGSKRILSWRLPLEESGIQLLQYINSKDLIKKMKL